MDKPGFLEFQPGLRLKIIQLIDKRPFGHFILEEFKFSIGFLNNK